jgi:tyrosyl-tRNA synthetase
MDVLDELTARGFIKQCSDIDGLRSALAAGPVTFYVGFDPTADSLHVGHLLPITIMEHLQRAGHIPIAVVGGGTGMVGDPSGKTEARMLLDEAAIAANVASLRAQLSRFLVLDEEHGTMVDNAEWLLDLRYIPFLRDIGSCFSVNKMLTAEGYRMRLERGLSFIEFNYQLLQAYDFLILHQRYGCSLQIGGDDQWGNILAGLDLIRRKEQGAAFALTLPLLTTATGQKMGKTHTGAVWLAEERFSAFDFYQYWLNVDDRDVGRMLRLYTFVPLSRIEALEALQGAAIREAKAELAYELTRRVHGEEAAERARDGAKAMVAGEAAEDLPTHTIAVEALAAGLPVAVAMADAGLCKSRGEARRLIAGGGVRLDSDKVDDPEAVLSPAQVPDGGVVLRVGKKRAVRLIVG